MARHRTEWPKQEAGGCPKGWESVVRRLVFVRRAPKSYWKFFTQRINVLQFECWPLCAECIVGGRSRCGDTNEEATTRVQGEGEGSLAWACGGHARRCVVLRNAPCWQGPERGCVKG